MSGKTRVFLRGYFQCSPDAFEPRMTSVDVESSELFTKCRSGYEVVGAEPQTSNAEVAASSASSNNRMQAALDAFEEYLHSATPEQAGRGFMSWCQERLNAPEAPLEK